MYIIFNIRTQRKQIKLWVKNSFKNMLCCCHALAQLSERALYSFMSTKQINNTFEPSSNLSNTGTEETE